MEAALAGVIGVAAGSVASVGTQLWVAWWNRVTESVAGARIVYSALADVGSTLQLGRDNGTWGVGGPTPFVQALALWEANRAALARGMGAVDFTRFRWRSWT